MGLISMAGWFLTLKTSLKYFDTKEILIRFFDCITAIVSPTLPTALSMGVMFAIHRLKTKKVFCISPNKIDVAGRVSTIVFDKTGTLTEEGLNLAGHK